MSWKSEVYKADRTKKKRIDEWAVISAEVFERDKHRCQRCGDKQRYKRYLQAHHIKPRNQGGPDTLENLITLCLSCHNWVEERVDVLITAELIKNSADVGTQVEKYHAAGYADANRPPWHRHVYGGGRNPKL